MSVKETMMISIVLKKFRTNMMNGGILTKTCLQSPTPIAKLIYTTSSSKT